MVGTANFIERIVSQRWFRIVFWKAHVSDDSLTEVSENFNDYHKDQGSILDYINASEDNVHELDGTKESNNIEEDNGLDDGESNYEAWNFC